MGFFISIDLSLTHLPEKYRLEGTDKRTLPPSSRCAKSDAMEKKQDIRKVFS